jgi:hypothetical protein
MDKEISVKANQWKFLTGTEAIWDWVMAWELNFAYNSAG